MLRSNLAIIHELREFFDEASNNETAYRQSPKNFTRTRKLPFKTLCALILQQLKRCLAIEVHDFMSLIEEEETTVTTSAISKARRKLKHELFIDWNSKLLNKFYNSPAHQCSLWNGFRILGVDGSTVYLFDTEDLAEVFGSQPTPGGDVVMARAVCGHDVANDMAVKTELVSLSQSETATAAGWLKDLKADPFSNLCIYDRGFASFGFIYMHEYHQMPFVIRCKLSFNNVVKEFVASGSQSRVVEFEATSAGINFVRNQGLPINSNAKVRVRLVRVELDGGDTEILITSLLDEEQYPNGDFKALYFMRWGVEVYFGRLKNQLKLEMFSGRSAELIKQDFYAAIFLSNFHSLLLKEADERIEETTAHRKHKYKAKRNVSLGFLKKAIAGLFLLENPGITLKRLMANICRHIRAEIKGRSSPRKKRANRSTGKYQTHTNHSPSI